MTRSKKDTFRMQKSSAHKPPTTDENAESTLSPNSKNGIGRKPKNLENPHDFNKTPASLPFLNKLQNENKSLNESMDAGKTPVEGYPLMKQDKKIAKTPSKYDKIPEKAPMTSDNKELLEKLYPGFTIVEIKPNVYAVVKGDRSPKNGETGRSKTRTETTPTPKEKRDLSKETDKSVVEGLANNEYKTKNNFYNKMNKTPSLKAINIDDNETVPSFGQTEKDPFNP